MYPINTVTVIIWSRSIFSSWAPLIEIIFYACQLCPLQVTGTSHVAVLFSRTAFVKQHPEGTIAGGSITQACHDWVEGNVISAAKQCPAGEHGSPPLRFFCHSGYCSIFYGLFTNRYANCPGTVFFICVSSTWSHFTTVTVYLHSFQLISCPRVGKSIRDGRVWRASDFIWLFLATVEERLCVFSRSSICRYWSGARFSKNLKKNLRKT